MNSPFLDLRLADCMDLMKTFPDGHFDLAIVDPPYGIGEDGGKCRTRGSKRTNGDAKGWDKEPPPPEYFAELRRVSNYQIIWGGNYFADMLPASRCWIYWQKDMGGDFADGELAWTNLEKAVRRKVHQWHGMLRKGGEDRHHPTQKPLEVIQWAIQQAGDVETILDPWAGSGTTGHAAKNLGKRCVMIERDERYCEITALRLAQDVLPLFPDNV